MCSLSFGSALADSSSPILATIKPWSPSEELAGPVIAVMVIGVIILGLLIGVIAVWLASKVLISNHDTTFAAAVAVCFLQFAAAIGIAIFHALVVFVSGAPSNSASGALITLSMLVVTVVLNIKIAGRVYGIGALHAFCFNLLSSFFTLLICGFVVGAFLVVGGIGLGAARARMQASAEQIQHGGLSVIQPSTTPLPPVATPAPDFSAEIDSLLEAALHPHGPPPTLVEREAIVRQLQEKLQAQRNNLVLGDTHAVATYQNRLNRYLALLNAVKAERRAQAAHEATATRQSNPGAAPPP